MHLGGGCRGLYLEEKRCMISIVDGVDDIKPYNIFWLMHVLHRCPCIILTDVSLQDSYSHTVTPYSIHWITLTALSYSLFPHKVYRKRADTGDLFLDHSSTYFYSTLTSLKFKFLRIFCLKQYIYSWVSDTEMQNTTLLSRTDIMNPLSAFFMGR